MEYIVIEVIFVFVGYKCLEFIYIVFKNVVFFLKGFVVWIYYIFFIGNYVYDEGFFLDEVSSFFGGIYFWGVYVGYVGNVFGWS